jgi:hypothetical protein
VLGFDPQHHKTNKQTNKQTNKKPSSILQSNQCLKKLSDLPKVPLTVSGNFELKKNDWKEIHQNVTKIASMVG